MVEHWKLTLYVTDGTDDFKYTTMFPAHQDGWPDAPETASEAITKASDEAEGLGMRVYDPVEIRRADLDLLI